MVPAPFSSPNTSCVRFSYRSGTPFPAAFTVVELLIAMGMAAIILVSLLEIFSQAMSAWNTETKRESIMRESRSGLRLLADDLNSLVALPAAATASEDAQIQRFILHPPADVYSSSAFAFLRVSRVARRSETLPETGDLKLVAYAVGLSTDANGAVSQKLWRRELSAAETLSRLETHLTSHAPLISNAEWASFVGADGFLKNNSADFGYPAEPLIHDVIRFVLTPLRLNAASAALEAAPAPWPAHEIPSHVDLVLRVTNRATAARLQTFADWSARGAAASLLLGHPQTATDYTDDPEVRTHTLQLGLAQSNLPPP